MTDLFKNLIGQEPIKKRLNFYIEAHRTSKTVFPSLLFDGARGLGKTTFARAVGKGLLDKNGNPRRFIEINSATIKNAAAFFEQVYIKYLTEEVENIIFFDEAHALPSDLIDVFLSVFDIKSDNHVSSFTYEGEIVNFDFRKLTVFFATTESDKLPTPLKERLTIIDFQPYSCEEVCQIFLANLSKKNISIETEALKELSTLVRGSARNVVTIGKDIETYLNIKTGDKRSFSKEDCPIFVSKLGLNPYGLTSMEKTILMALKDRGACSLAQLAAVTGLTRSAIQKYHELYLLKQGFLEIDGKRKLTARGNKVLEQCELVEKV